MRSSRRKHLFLFLALFCFSILMIATFMAPDQSSTIDRARASLMPWEAPPFGTDMNGRPLLEYATQGAKVIAFPSLLAGVLVAFFGMIGGLLRLVDSPIIQTVVQVLGELVGALPRMVVILVAALLIPMDWRSLLPLAVIWAVLCAPGAIDEAGSVTNRLGGARFVEALKAHGFSAWRIYMHHIVWHNLRPVIVRQGAEAMMMVAFLEVALSYLALVEEQSSFTHSDGVRSWADLLKEGYLFIAFNGSISTGHSLVLGIGLLGLVVVTAMAVGKAAEAR